MVVTRVETCFHGDGVLEEGGQENQEKHGWEISTKLNFNFLYFRIYYFIF